MKPQLTPRLAAGFLLLVTLAFVGIAVNRHVKVGPNQVRLQPVNDTFSKTVKRTKGI